MGSTWKSTKPLLWSAALLVAGLLLVDLVLSVRSMGDYAPSGATAGDNAAPGLNALLHGDLAGYAARQPAIGLTSILLRLPFAALSHALGGGALVTYQLGALAALLPVGFFAAWLMAGRAIPPGARLAGALAGLLVLAGPVLRESLMSGHPEAALAGVLATGSVIAATRGHAGRAATLLGLAAGAKPWALIALPPVMMALPGRRVRTAAIAGAIAFPLCAVAPLADPGAFARALHGEGSTNLINPFSLWWPLSESFHLPSGQIAPARLLPFGLSRAQSPGLVLLLALPALAMAYARARHRRTACDPLALLALLAVVRCLCDSTHLEYYYLSILIPLAAWEVVALGRLPWLTALGTVAIGLIPNLAEINDPAAVWAGSVAATLVLAVYLARCAFVARPGAAPESAMTLARAA